MIINCQKVSPTYLCVICADNTILYVYNNALFVWILPDMYVYIIRALT